MNALATHADACWARPFRAWADRIGSLHDDLVKEICAGIVCDGGLSAEEADATSRFLVHRKTRIGALLRDSSDSMPRIAQWDLT